MRRCYIATYPLSADGNDLDETILFEDTYYSPTLQVEWDALVTQRAKTDPMLQCWYYDDHDTQLMATTNQPYRLP